MKTYLVGGAVRDKLLGLPVKERDYVVVGATESDMLRLGFRQVGKEFPVFLHPKTNEEYALARMERKTQPGYKGFEFDTTPTVTLAEDLIRRDLTINAMAQDIETGELIDPYHGAQDVKAKILRHVSPAFAEDPVRILRVGRFLARYAALGFKVAPETITLMQQMVDKGEVNALVAERVWKELERALGEKNPEEFFNVLELAHARKILFPDLEITGNGMKALRAATQLTPSAVIRFSVLAHEWTREAVQLLCKRYRAPNAYKELAQVTALHYQEALMSHTAAELINLFNKLDIYRRQSRFDDFVQATRAIAAVKKTQFDAAYLLNTAAAAKSVDVHQLLKQGFKNQELAKQLLKEREKAVANYMASLRNAK